MKTDRLVSLLSSRIEPIDARKRRRDRMMLLAGGAVGSLVMCLGLLGINPHLRAETAQELFWLKEAYSTALAVLGFIAVARLSRPGRSSRRATVGIVGVLAAMWAVGLIAMLRAQPDERTHLIFGSTAAVCPLLIALLSIPAWLGYLGAVRSLAPTHLRGAGAASGFAAGAYGALVYSLHCPELAAPFVGIWYLLGMVIPAGLGAFLGPRLLRW